jgi:acetylornithine deacetylase
MSLEPAADLRRRLTALVSADTQNPTGDERPLAEALARELAALGARTVETFAVDGHHSSYAVFGDGTPTLLVNAHLDTVPANAGYTSPPLALVQRETRLHGLGAADTKGAIAAILAALAVGPPRRAVAILFSGDEEHGSQCLRAFLDGPLGRGLTQAIVCEPTGLQVGHRHRGIGSALMVATSPGGHSSRADFVPNPVVTLARAAVALDQWGASKREEGPAGFRGLCVNVAAIDGGVAFNVIPSRATLRVSVRPAPGVEVESVLAEAEGEARRAAAPEDVTWDINHSRPSFSTRDLASFGALLGQRVDQPVDLAFWTEAALFGAAGIDAVVFGPGDIAQAHAPDEFVELDQLVQAREAFLKVFS